jgi:hypothetical protein
LTCLKRFLAKLPLLEKEQNRVIYALAAEHKAALGRVGHHG